jgi:hypothetical protein
MSSKTQSVNGSESEFEFIETPKAPTPTFEKFEECGVRTTSVSLFTASTFAFGSLQRSIGC